MGKILEAGQKMQIPSPLFNSLIVINDSPFNLDIEPMHDNIVLPLLIIRSVTGKEGGEDDKAIETQLKEREGIEV